MSGRWGDLDRPPLDVPALRRALTGPGRPWVALDVVEVTGSTNADLAVRAREEPGVPAGTVLVADHQVSGRGRRGRSWSFPPRSGLAVSVLLRPGPDAARWPWLPLLAGTALVAALERTAGLETGLKWPNDVLVGPPEAERKLAGVLADVVATPHGPALVLGVGLNVTAGADELPVPTATSLRLAGASCTDRDPLLRAYLRALAERLRGWEAAGGDAEVASAESADGTAADRSGPDRSGADGSVGAPPRTSPAAQYRAVCRTLGRRVQLQLPGRPPVSGFARDVDGAGRLVVERDDGLREAFAAGDVEHLRPSP